MRLGHYILGPRKIGIIYRPDKYKGMECYVDSDLYGGWTQADSKNTEDVLSQTGYFIMYAGCPIHFVSKLQTEISLSTSESEYILCIKPCGK